jgi:hypothetical protein
MWDKIKFKYSVEVYKSTKTPKKYKKNKNFAFTADKKSSFVFKVGRDFQNVKICPNK